MRIQRIATGALAALAMFSSVGCERAERAQRVEPAERAEITITEYDAPTADTIAAAEPAVGDDGPAGAVDTVGIPEAGSGNDTVMSAELATPVGTDADPSALVAGVRATAPQWSTKPEAFDFFAPELFSGSPVSGADLYSTGPVMMTFVSPSCVVSIEDAAAFAEVAEREQSVTFVIVHTDGDQASFEQFVDDADLYQQNVIHIDDSDLTLWNRFSIEVQPSTVLLDNEGRASLTTGGLDHEGLAVAVGLIGAVA